MFVSNWRFAATGTDYFAQGAPSPLQNFWSLGVEEQFYFVWPWLMLGVLLLGTRFMRRSAQAAVFAAGVIMVAIVLVSFLWALQQSGSSPTLAYFSTFTRAWELGAGAILAIFAGVFSRMWMSVRVVMAWVGIAVMIGSMFLIDATMQFPAPWAALPVVGAMLAIAAGIGREPAGNVLLSNPFAQYVGDISYSLYLWHWPVIILAAALFPERTLPVFIGTIVVAVALSVLSYELLEHPVLASPLFKPGLSKRARRAAWSEWRYNTTPRMRGMTLIVAVPAVVLLVVGMILFPPGRLSGAELERAQSYVPPSTDPTAAPEYEATDPINQGIYDALQDGEWPADLSPSIDTAASAGAPAEEKMRCGDPNVRATSCTFGDPNAPRAIVYGDSLGATLLPTVRAALESEFFIRGLTAPNCAITDIEVKFDSQELADRCMVHRQAIRDVTASTQPEVVFVIQNYVWADRLTSGAKGTPMQEEWAEGARTLTDDLKASGARNVIFVSPPPMGDSIADCAVANAPPSACAIQLGETWRAIRAAEAESVTFLDETDWFCVELRCPAFNGNTLVRRDHIHPTAQYATAIAPVWRERALALLTAG